MLFAAVWHLAGGVWFPGSRPGRQARRRLANKGLGGALYFGAVLGTGLLTAASTPLVLAGAVLTIGSGAASGAAYGVGFGLGRSLPAWIGVVSSLRDLGAREVQQAIAGLAPTLRWAGFPAALIGISIAIWGLAG